MHRMSNEGLGLTYAVLCATTRTTHTARGCVCSSVLQYCTPQDRRMQSEITGGLKPAGETKITDGPTPDLPPGCYGLQEGYAAPPPHLPSVAATRGVTFACASTCTWCAVCGC